MTSVITKSHLTREDIIDVTGESTLESLQVIEILFNGFQEIGGLEECTTLQKIAFIDNGQFIYTYIHTYIHTHTHTHTHTETFPLI